jgi:hypothetical protein
MRSRLPAGGARKYEHALLEGGIGTFHACAAERWRARGTLDAAVPIKRADSRRAAALLAALEDDHEADGTLDTLPQLSAQCSQEVLFCPCNCVARRGRFFNRCHAYR